MFIFANKLISDIFQCPKCTYQTTEGSSGTRHCPKRTYQTTEGSGGTESISLISLFWLANREGKSTFFLIFVKKLFYFILLVFIFFMKCLFYNATHIFVIHKKLCLIKKCMNIQMKKSMTIVRHAHLNEHTFQVLLLGHPYSQTHILRLRYIPGWWHA